MTNVEVEEKCRKIWGSKPSKPLNLANEQVARSSQSEGKRESKERVGICFGDGIRAQRFGNIYIDYISQRMFSGLAYEVPAQTGKKTFGAPIRKEPGFSIGWDNSNQMNDFQLRKSKNKEVTGKITTQAIINQQQILPQRNPYQPQSNNHYELQAKDYQQIFYENPNITRQELDKMMEAYEHNRGVPSRSSKQGSIAENERRTPILPRESIKGILYNGVGVGQEVHRGARVCCDVQKRNNYPQRSEGHNYYQGNI